QEGQYEDVIPGEALPPPPPPPPAPVRKPIPTKPPPPPAKIPAAPRPAQLPPLPASKPKIASHKTHGSKSKIAAPSKLAAAPAAKSKLAPPGTSPPPRPPPARRAMHTVIPNESFNVFNVVYVSQSFKNRNDKL
ncbi:hypothetical protein TELCIR_25468, partial [Teladorsagia circumcincta]